MKKILFGCVVLAMGIMTFEACSPANGNNPGHEYMPDMAHSVAVEANAYDDYSLHTWDKESVKPLKETSMPRKPVTGSIARGYAGMSNSAAADARMKEMTGQGRGIYTPINGNVPYYYSDTEEERTRANKEIVMNPYPITKAGIEKGKELYLIYCGICHGEKAAGDGYLVRDGGKYPAQPANLVSDTFLHSNNGRFYHAIMYGKNVMGSYADKLSYEERWQVIHYIRSCEAASKNFDYSEESNTFKPESAMTLADSDAFKAGKAVKKEVLTSSVKAVKVVEASKAAETIKVDKK